MIQFGFIWEKLQENFSLYVAMGRWCHDDIKKSVL